MVSNRLRFTGNPFVDGGLAVMTRLAGRDCLSELTLADVRKLVDDGSHLTRDNSRLKSFTMVFGTNGVLTQPAYKKTGQNEVIYKAIVQRFLNAAGQEGSQKVPNRKWIGRDWVPLAGSLGNDAQALPAASWTLHVSATALLALQYLPLGLFLYQGRLGCYQSTYEPLMQQLTADIVECNRDRLEAGDTEILGKGGGSSVLLDFLVRRFEQIENVRTDFELPPNTTLFLWLFSNSGTGADCRVIEIPGFDVAFSPRCLPRGLLDRNPPLGNG